MAMYDLTLGFYEFAGYEYANQPGMLSDEEISQLLTKRL